MKKEKMQEMYRQFNECLDNFEEEGKCLPSYEEICAIIGVGPRCMDEMLYAELGVSGVEIMESYGN